MKIDEANEYSLQLLQIKCLALLFSSKIKFLWPIIGHYELFFFILYDNLPVTVQ